MTSLVVQAAAASDFFASLSTVSWMRSILLCNILVESVAGTAGEATG